MTTITIAPNVTMSLTPATAKKWFAYKKALENFRRITRTFDLDWEEVEDLEIEVWEAWEQFCSQAKKLKKGLDRISRLCYTTIRKGKEIKKMTYELEMAIEYGADFAILLNLAGVAPEEWEEE